MQYPFLAHTSHDFFLNTLTRPLPLPLPLLPVEGLLVLKLRTCAVLLEISFVDFSFASKPRCRRDSSSNFTGFWALFLCLRSLSGFKLGNLSDLEEGSVQQSRNLGFSAMESPSSKRARAHNNSAQVPSCLVDGCNSDLSKCRDYHRRHKVCELHSKTPRVTIRGQEQRFCQQCSRFHSLGEFDDGKRSCRKRLDGHNKRRRKPQPDPSLSSSHFLINYQGTKLVPFSSPQMFPASALASCPLVGASRSENDSVLYCSNSHQQLNFGDRQMLFSASSSDSYKPQIQFPFMQGNKDLSIGSSSVCGTSLDPNPLSGSSDGCSSQKTIPSSLVGPLSSPGCALSLLSSSLPAAAAAAQASHQRDADATMQFYPPEPSHSSMSTLHYNQVRAVSESEGSFLAAPGSLHVMFRGGHSGSSASGSQSHHSPSFTWE